MELWDFQQGSGFNSCTEVMKGKDNCQQAFYWNLLKLVGPGDSSTDFNAQVSQKDHVGPGRHKGL